LVQLRRHQGGEMTRGWNAWQNAGLRPPSVSRMVRYSGSQVFCLIAIERKLRPANFVS
jgi:hypothetical protein